jgi:hypothetical protein
MRIISIDVGIKNLAYCILETDSVTNEYKIIQWDVINLCGEQHMCNCVLKEKVKKEKVKKLKEKKEDTQQEANIDVPSLSLCNKKAMYCKAGQYYCQTHAKQSTEYFLPNASLKNIKKWKRDALVAYAVAQGIVIDESCKKDALLALITTYLAAKTWEKITSVSANDMTLIQMGVQLVKDFDRVLGDEILGHEIPAGNSISMLDKIVIENQISPIANRMKTLQGMIAQYFIMRGNPKIAFISSANKLKMFSKPKVNVDMMCESESKSKTTYSERKKAGVEIVKELLPQNNVIWLPTFLTHKKKDDLADAFLQGVWFLHKK